MILDFEFETGCWREIFFSKIAKMNLVQHPNLDIRSSVFFQFRWAVLFSGISLQSIFTKI